MSQTGLPEFDTTVQETNIWLNEIGEGMGNPDKRRAYHALRGVTHALRDRLPIDQVFHLSSQVPMLIRGIMFDGYHPTGKPEKFNEDEFIHRVSEELQKSGGENPQDATRAVFHVMNEHMTGGEVEKVRNALPKGLRDLWPELAKK